ncbi:MAG: hypothetical protein ACE5EM_11360 [Sphingomonadales bacterium]
MGVFDTLFRGRGKEDQRSALEHPRDLQLGDIVKFGFVAQADLSNSRFEVTAINTYDWRDGTDTVFILKGERGNIVWVQVVEEDGDEHLAISRKMTRAQVETLFDPEAFATVFEEGAGTELDARAVPDGFENWTAARYAEMEDCTPGYYHEGDYRARELPKYEDEATGLDYYLLIDDSEQFAIEIEVYTAGDTEVSATIYLEPNVIDELWPANKRG